MAHILLIDDDSAVRSVMREVLERSGHEIRTAEDGEEGLRLFRERAADLIVTDLFMPDKEGIETIQELRQQAPDVKILAVSGGGLERARDPDGPLSDAELFGADASLPKPFTVDELRRAVEELLEVGS